MGEFYFRINGVTDGVLRRCHQSRATTSLARIRPRAWFAVCVLAAAAVYLVYDPGKFTLAPVSTVGSSYASTFQVAGEVGDANVREVVVSANGFPQTVPVSNGRFQARVPLQPGANAIRASLSGAAADFSPISDVVLVSRLMPYAGPLQLPAGGVVSEGSPRTIEPGLQEFEVTLGRPPQPGVTYGMVGGGGYYRGVVTVAIIYELPGDGTIRLRADRARSRVNTLQQQNPGGLALLTWSFALSDLNAGCCVSGGRAVFDHGMAAFEKSEDGSFTAYVPRGQSRLDRIEVLWKWENISRTLRF